VHNKIFAQHLQQKMQVWRVTSVIKHIPVIRTNDASKLNVVLQNVIPHVEGEQDLNVAVIPVHVKERGEVMRLLEMAWEMAYGSSLLGCS